MNAPKIDLPESISDPAWEVIALLASFEDADTPTMAPGSGANPYKSLDRLLKRAVATMVEFAGAERGFLLLFEDMDVTHKVVYGMAVDDTDEFSSSLAYQVLFGGESLFVEDAQTDGFFSQQASVRALALRSVLGVPLIVKGEAIGVMIADSKRIATAFDATKLELLEALARRVGTAIGDAHMRAKAARQDALLAMIERLALATTGMSDLASFMAPLANEALGLAQADRLCLLVGPDLVCHAAFERGGAVLSPTVQQPSQSASRWVYDQGESLHLHDAAESASFGGQQSVMALGLRTIHAVPIDFAGQRLGVLYLDAQRVGTEDPYVTEALQRIGTFAGAFLSRRGLMNPIG